MCVRCMYVRCMHAVMYAACMLDGRMARAHNQCMPQNRTHDGPRTMVDGRWAKSGIPRPLQSGGRLSPAPMVSRHGPWPMATAHSDSPQRCLHFHREIPPYLQPALNPHVALRCFNFSSSVEAAHVTRYTGHYTGHYGHYGCSNGRTMPHLVSSPGNRNSRVLG